MVVSKDFPTGRLVKVQLFFVLLKINQLRSCRIAHNCKGARLIIFRPISDRLVDDRCACNSDQILQLSQPFCQGGNQNLRTTLTYQGSLSFFPVSKNSAFRDVCFAEAIKKQQHKGELPSQPNMIIINAQIQIIH